MDEMDFIRNYTAYVSDIWMNYAARQMQDAFFLEPTTRDEKVDFLLECYDGMLSDAEGTARQWKRSGTASDAFESLLVVEEGEDASDVISFHVGNVISALEALRGDYEAYLSKRSSGRSVDGAYARAAEIAASGGLNEKKAEHAGESLLDGFIQMAARIE